MAKVLLKVGCETILLPDDTGIASILKALSRGVSVRDHLYKKELELEGRTLEIGMSLVPPNTRFIDPDRVLTPEEQGYVRIKPKRLNGQAILRLEDRDRG